MRFVVLFLLGTASVLVSANNPILVCRDDRSDICKCTLVHGNPAGKTLRIFCNTNLKTTHIVVSNYLMKDVIEVEISFVGIGITQITKPLLNSQLSGLVTKLGISKNNISMINANVFDDLRKLKSLEIDDVMNGKLLETNWLTQTLGKSLKSLTLERNDIAKIPSRSFNNLASLEELNIRSCGVKEISDVAFDNLPALKILYLSRNNINKISSNSFGNLPQLAQLYFDYNQISEISKRGFRNLPSLSKVDLSSNNLQTIPDSSVFAQPNQLMNLILNENQIKKITEHSLDGYDKLENLTIQSNRLEQISVGAFKPSKRLIRLDLYNNAIRNISAGTFDGIKQIRGIRLSSNQIEKIPDGTFDALASLEELDLSSNKRLSLNDRTFGSNGLVNLKSLDLSRCNLDTLPSVLLKNLPSLTDLYIGQNDFTEIPAIIRNAKSLQTLDLSFNDISSLQTNAFGSTSSLVKIQMNNMSKGTLMVIQDCAFCGIQNLKYVTLNNNEGLKQINENAFGFAKNSTDRAINMVEIEIQDGGLKTVPEKLLPWKKLKGISIRGNPANCVASMDWLFLNKSYYIIDRRTDRYRDRAWCEQCLHDQTCKLFYG